MKGEYNDESQLWMGMNEYWEKNGNEWKWMNTEKRMGVIGNERILRKDWEWMGLNEYWETIGNEWDWMNTENKVEMSGYEWIFNDNGKECIVTMNKNGWNFMKSD